MFCYVFGKPSEQLVAKTILTVDHSGDDGAHGWSGYSTVKKTSKLINEYFEIYHSKAQSVFIETTRSQTEDDFSGYFSLPYTGPDIDLTKFRSLSLIFSKKPLENETDEEMKKREDYLTSRSNPLINPVTYKISATRFRIAQK